MSATAQSIKQGVTWINEHGSTLTIDNINPETGALRGTYVSRMGKNCVGTKYATVGWVDEERLTFSVRWKNESEHCGSLATWSGYHVNGKIIAHWDFVYFSPLEGRTFIHRGSDTFEPCVAGKPKGCPPDTGQPADQSRSTPEKKP